MKHIFKNVFHLCSVEERRQRRQTAKNAKNAKNAKYFHTWERV